MRTITAVLRAKPGAEEVLKAALLNVADHVAEAEPATLGFFVTQDIADPCRFTTYERFVNAAAMDQHNNSDAVAAFFSAARPLLDGEVTLVIAVEISAKPG